MKKKYIKIKLLLLLLPALGMAQHHYADSLETALRKAPNDSVRYQLDMQVGYYFQELQRDSALRYYDAALLVARRHNKKIAEAGASGIKGYQLALIGRYAESLQCLQDALNLIDENKSEDNGWVFAPGDTKPKNPRLYTLARLQLLYSVLMHVTKNTAQEIFYLKESIKTAKLVNDPYRIAIPEINLGNAYMTLHMLDSALYEEKEGLKTLQFSVDKKYVGNALTRIGILYLYEGKLALGKKYLYEGLQWSAKTENLADLGRAYFGLTNYYLAKHDKDSSLINAKKNLQIMFLLPSGDGDRDFNMDDVYENLTKSYSLNNKPDSVIKYQAKALKTKDSIYRSDIKNLAAFQNLGFRRELHLRDLEKQRLAYESRVRIYAMLAGIGVVLLIALILYRNNRQKQKANVLLNRQKEEVQEALSQLKATQAQLIQREKMASLGELTAGIAHEIQNPLNFVNNFSEVNREMLEELKTESGKPKAERDEELEMGLIDDLIENEGKINHHGKRADFIVKGMLQHSRKSTGEKQSTNMNVLCEEFLKLSFHGMEAKDKSFNAEMVTHFDPNLPSINVSQQDLGRVMLNLFNNAFYAVNQKAKTAGINYKPEVTVTTSLENGRMIIKVRDNGAGISESIKEKIMQPFFTTKPTGEGTGLGLSLSYDIVVKGHGGNIQVNSVDGDGAEFIITLPVN